MVTQKYGFVYIWRDRKHKRFYIGSHWGTENDGYICGSTWMRNAFAKRPLDFKRRILKRVYTNRKDTFNEEQIWLTKIKQEELGNKYYNLRLNFSFIEGVKKTYFSEETKQKISNRPKRQVSKETREKMRQSRLGTHPSEETKEKLRFIARKRRGRHLSKRHIECLRQSRLGTHHSEETKEKMRKIALKRPLMSEEQKIKLRIPKKDTSRMGRKRGFVQLQETKEKIRQGMLKNYKKHTLNRSVNQDISKSDL